MIDPQSSNESTDPAGDKNSEKPDPKNLTPEEQLAAYEEQLKEDDWGHQPC